MKTEPQPSFSSSCSRKPARRIQMNAPMKPEWLRGPVTMVFPPEEGVRWWCPSGYGDPEVSSRRSRGRFISAAVASD